MNKVISNSDKAMGQDDITESNVQVQYELIREVFDLRQK